MLDIGWWELLLLGIVALIVVGPNELPALLRTIGRYVGMAKRQADDFRDQFNDALRESEFNDLRDEMTSLQSDMKSSISQADQSVRNSPAASSSDKSHPTGTDDDWDEEPISPAPEFAGDEPTTSFTMADGTVVTKGGSEAAPNGDKEPSSAPDASPAPEAAQTDTKAPGAPSADAAPAQPSTKTDDGATTPPSNEASAATNEPSKRDVEAVR